LRPEPCQRGWRPESARSERLEARVSQVSEVEARSVRIEKFVARVSQVREVEARSLRTEKFVARVSQVREVEVGVRQMRADEAMARKIEVKSTTRSRLGQENPGQVN
jgi:hypothetical protein